MRKPETRLQQQIRNKLQEEFGGYWRKIHGSPFQHGGMPDIIGCVDGLFFGFEVKRIGKELDLLQKEEVDAICQANGVAARVQSPEEAINLVRWAVSRAKKGRRLSSRSSR